MRDLINGLDFKRGISPAAAVTDNTPFVSQILDVAGYEGAGFVILTGSLADADATFTALLEHGDVANLSDAAAVPDADLHGLETTASFTFAHDDSIRKIGYRGVKRYLRLTVTPTNNSGNAFVAAIGVRGFPRFGPTANPPV